MKTVNHKPHVKDTWLFVILYPVMAISIIFIGNDNKLRALLSIPSFYTDLLLAFSCTFIAGLYFRFLFSRIDKKYDWDSQFRQRLISQFIWGILIPVVSLLSLEMGYLYLIGIPLKDSPIFYLELPIITLFCTIINLIYFFLYYQKYNLNLQSEFKKSVIPSSKEFFVVTAGNKFINIPLDQVSYFISRHKITFLVTVSGKDYVYDSTLKNLWQHLPAHHFFQLNRQVIATRHGIYAYFPTETRRLEIRLNPATDNQVFIAKNRATEFIAWLDKK